MEKKFIEQEQTQTSDEEELISRREYLISLKKWSKAVIGGVLLGGVIAHTGQDAEARSWINNRGNWGNNSWNNRGGGAWVNNRGGGGAWGNRGNSWGNRGGSWGNRSGGGWVNRY